MISKLQIKNYAIIDELELQFTNGLNIITGETGAGKSILMGALGLILGNRAESGVLFDEHNKCFVEGTFDVHHDKGIKEFFEANDLEYDSELVIRREISSNGKSRSFINDSPVNLSQVKSLSALLVDLHQQFDTQEIYAQDFQCSILDALSDHANLINSLQVKFHSYDSLSRELKALQLEHEKALRDADYDRFLLEELSELSLKENELEDLEDEMKMLSNAEQIKQQLSFAVAALSASENPIAQQIKQIQLKLSQLATYHSGIGDLSERLKSLFIELDDIANEVVSIENKMNVDAERITVINDRLSAGYSLYKKHNVNSTAQLLVIQGMLAAKNNNVEKDAELISSLERQVKSLYEECLSIAQKISQNRKSSIQPLKTSTNELLHKVGMPNASIQIEVKEKSLSADGIDEVSFLFDANKSGKFESLNKVASGGELSRLMLSIKSLVAQKLELPTLIFDEIDTGISGEAAKQVGLIMKSLANQHQIIAITHQPQIAAKATTHFFVHKFEKDNRITTGVRKLDEAERIISIAKMLSGEEPTDAAIANAKELICH